MKIVELPIEISKYSLEEYEEFQSLGLDVPEDSSEPGVLRIIYPYSIAGFVERGEEIDLELSSGTHLTIQLTLEEFLDKLND